MRTKYIIVAGHNGIWMPIVFSEFMVHADVARAMRKSIGEVVSAGFCNMTPDGWRTYGESISLNLPSRGAIDDKIFEALL